LAIGTHNLSVLVVVITQGEQAENTDHCAVTQHPQDIDTTDLLSDDLVGVLVALRAVTSVVVAVVVPDGDDGGTLLHWGWWGGHVHWLHWLHDWLHDGLHHGLHHWLLVSSSVHHFFICNFIYYDLFN
jgi:hypothetical protein